MLPLKLRLLKRFDRTAGPWLCGQVSPSSNGAAEVGHNGQPSWSAAPVPARGIERILVIRPGGIGDAVLTYPMIRALREHYREAAIDVLGERRNVGVYRINDLVRNVYRYDDAPIASVRMIRRLKREQYQIVIDTEQYHHLSTLVANYLRPNFICGFDTVGRGRFHTHRVRYVETTYEVYLFLSLAAALIGRPLAFDPNSVWLTVDRKAQDWAEGVLTKNGERPIVVIGPGVSTEHKYWAPTRYAQVARWLIKKGYYVVVLGGADTIEAAREVAADHTADTMLNLAGLTTLAQTAGILQRSKLYVSSDTGALHIAYGVGIPTVHMFGSGIMEKWAPQGRKYVVINKGLPCSPCTRYGYTPPCPYGVACMDAITVEDVTRAVEEVLRL